MKWICLLGFLAGLAGCGSELRRFPLRPPMWQDTDLVARRAECRPDPEAPTDKPGHQLCRPDAYDTYFFWDGADNMLFRPMVHFFKFQPKGEAINVNAFDEVPDSSWFVNRIGRRRLEPEALAKGACADDKIDTDAAEKGSWLIDQGKANGANPGFRVKLPDGRKYMLKTDSYAEPERATGATSIATRFYHAAGWYTSCDSVIYLDREVLKLSPGLIAVDNTGEARPFDQNALDKVLSNASKRGDKIRFVASKWLTGRAIGPFTYAGTKEDDPNDVIPHEKRRDLRGARLMAAWLFHFDSREANSLAVWLSEDKNDSDASPGKVLHYYIDLGDCFGSKWEEGMWQRMGYASYFDFPFFFKDLFTFGIVERPWDRARMPEGSIFNHYVVDDFDAETWHPGYPNPSFDSMSERDGAWAARIIARFSDADIRLLAAAGDFTSAAQTAFLVKTIIARRDILLRRYFQRVSPVTDLEVVGDELCGVDLARATGVYGANAKFTYRAAARVGESLVGGATQARAQAAGRVCVDLPRAAMEDDRRDDDPGRYVVIELDNGQATGLIRAHLYDLGPTRGYRLVGIERDEGSAP